MTRLLLLLSLVLGGWFLISHGNVAKGQIVPMPEKIAPGSQVATFAGGCFWAMQAEFSQLKGIERIEAGYAGGHTASPTYEQVTTETTGYAEAVQMTFDPKVITYHDLLTIFLNAHNPTTKDRQGDDVGSSYRSAIFTRGAKQQEIAQQVVGEVGRAHVWAEPIVTEVVPYTNFARAEDYHQNYFAQNPTNPYCQFTVAPEVARFQKLNRARLKG